jgi:hypothetical protein
MSRCDEQWVVLRPDGTPCRAWRNRGLQLMSRGTAEAVARILDGCRAVPYTHYIQSGLTAAQGDFNA